MAQFVVIDIYQRETNPLAAPVLTITADSVDVVGPAAVFYTNGVKSAVITLSSEFLVEKI